MVITLTYHFVTLRGHLFFFDIMIKVFVSAYVLDHCKKSSSQEKAVLPCNFGVFHNKKGEKNCIVLSPCCIKTTWAYLEWSSTTLVNKTLTKRIWFKFGDVVEPVWRVWTFFGAASELSVMLKGQKSHLTKINTYQIFFKDVSDLKACLNYCEDPRRCYENLSFRLPAQTILLTEKPV